MTTETDSRLSYLDLELNIVDGRFTTAVFDKRDGFNFHIITWIATYLVSQPMEFTSPN